MVALFLFDTEREIIYSSHRYDAAMVVFRRLVSVIEGSALLRKRIKPVKHAHGLELVETTEGARAAFKTRTKLGRSAAIPRAAQSSNMAQVTTNWHIAFSFMANDG